MNKRAIDVGTEELVLIIAPALIFPLFGGAIGRRLQARKKQR